MYIIMISSELAPVAKEKHTLFPYVGAQEHTAKIQ